MLADEETRDGGEARQTVLVSRDALPSTIEEAIDTVGVGRAQWVLLILCGLTFMSDAAEVTFLSFVTEQLKCEWGLSSGQETSITQAVFVGMIVGAPLWGWTADRIGRRPSFLVSSVIICTFGFGTAACQNFWQLIIVRAIVGFGVAGLPVGFDILAEALPSSSRGSFLLYIEFFWTAGSIFVNVCAWSTLQALGWQVFTVLAAIPTLVASVAGAFVLPESPRWLMEEHRPEEALKIINRWAKMNKASRRFTTLVEQEKEHRPVSTAAELCSRGRLRRTTLLMTVVWFGFGLSYYGIVSLLPRLFQGHVASATEVPVGQCDIKFDFQDICISSVAEIAGVLVALAIIDRWGRTWTQGAFYTLGALMAVILGFGEMIPSFLLLTIAASVARAAQMAASCATWVHTPELFPTSVRAEAHTLLNLVSKVGAFLAQYLVSDWVAQVPCGMTMAAISFAAAVAALFLTETAGEDLSKYSDVTSEDICHAPSENSTDVFTDSDIERME